MWVPRTPDEVAKWREATVRESLSNALTVGLIVWVSISALAAGGLVLSNRGTYAVRTGMWSSFWARFPVCAAFVLPILCFGFWRIHESDVAKHERRTVCPKCNSSGESNAGSECGCGSVFVLCSSVRWVEDPPKPEEMTSQLVYQRIRNRVIEMLEWLVKCEASPPELGMDELINEWEGWVPSPFDIGSVPSPVFTAREQMWIGRVSCAVDAFCFVTPRSIKDEQAAIKLPEWAAVISAAKPALAAMTERGRMPEERELQL